MTGDDGGYVRFRAPHPAPGFRIKSGTTGERSEMTGVTCGSTPRTWVPACAGKTVGGVGDDGGFVRGSTPRTWVPACAGKTEEGPEMTGDDGGYVRFRAPHLGSGLRRKDGGGVGDDGG